MDKLNKGFNIEKIKFKYYAIGDESKKVSCEIFTLDEIESYPKDRIWNFAESLHENIVTYRKQYTGLKDKNGVEIYEGDIVIITEEDEDSCLGREFSYKGVVSYANSLKLSQYVSQYPSSFCLISKSFYREQALLFNDRWDYEVIGNIYANPDLLKG